MVVADLTRTVDFYRETLGFEVAGRAPSTGPGAWALLRRGDAVLLFHGAEGLLGGVQLRPGARVNVRLVVDDLPTLYDALNGRAVVVQPLGVDSRGTLEFAVRDCNGFVLTFVQAEQKKTTPLCPNLSEH